MTNAEISHLFNSRDPSRVCRPKRSGLSEWYALMFSGGALTAETVEYDSSPTRELRPGECRGSEGQEHVQLVLWAERTFGSEIKSPGVYTNRVPNYGVPDLCGVDRFIECGHTQLEKLLRSWSLGIQRFTIFPFVGLMGHRYVTISPTCSWASARTPQSLRLKGRARKKLEP